MQDLGLSPWLLMSVWPSNNWENWEQQSKWKFYLPVWFLSRRKGGSGKETKGKESTEIIYEGKVAELGLGLKEIGGGLI